MPFTLRGRLAIACAAVIVAVVGAYALLVRTLDNAQVLERHQRDDEASVISLARDLASSIRLAYESGEELTYRDPNDRPLPRPSLKAIVDGVAGHAWVLDKSDSLIYTSNAVYALPEANRRAVDSLVRLIPPGVTAEKNSAGGVALRPIFGGRVHDIGVSEHPLLLYAALVDLGPSRVNRIVVGRFATRAPAERTNLTLPFLFIIPIVLGVALGAAGVVARIALGPVDERIRNLINNVEAISDGRSLHKRLAMDESEVGEQLVRLTDTLNAMIARLEASFAGLRRFTADASHELKTPLTVLRADVERAMSSGTSHAEQLVALEEALAETTRMADLVDSLLTLARADEGRFDLIREPVDLEALAREVMETAVLLGERTGIAVLMNPPAHVTVPGDRARLRQMFLNLVTNAIKYTARGGTVELALVLEDGFAKFSVRDTGIGIAAADLPHVFERFWRADRARSRVGERGGFGLGLAISDYIAHAHGGSLTVKSRLGRGSTFTASLPVEHPTESAGEK